MANFSNNSSFVIELTPMSSAHSTAFIISLTMLMLCIIGAYGNLVSVIVFSHRTMKAPINILLRALSLIDTGLILSSVVVFIVPNLNLTFQNAKLRSACEFASLYVYPLSLTMQTCSIYSFVLVSLERYLAVCAPLQRHKLMTVTQARAAQVILPITALCYNFVRFWEYERTEYSDAGYAPIQPLLRFQKWYFLYYYVILYVVTHFLVPFGAILVLNALIVRALRTPVTGPSGNGQKPLKYRLRKFSRKQFRQRQTTHMIIMITLIFAVCNAPAFLINIWEGIDENLFYGPWSPVAYMALDISNNLVVFNSSSTFIIYLLYCHKYRTLFIRYGLCKMWGLRKKKRGSRLSKSSRSAGTEKVTVSEYCSVASIAAVEISVV